MPTKTRTELVQDFLRGLFGSIPGDSCLEVRAVPPGKGAKPSLHWYSKIAEVRAEDFGHNERAWFGVALRKAGTTSGTKSSLTWAPALWVDIDSYKEPTGTVLARLRRFTLPPTYIVDSGGGLHAYWKLSRPLDLRQPGQVAWLEEVAHGLAHTLGADVTARDAARMMGLPYTYNPGDGRRKVYDPPRERTILHTDLAAVYTVEDLNPFRRPLPAGPAPAAAVEEVEEEKEAPRPPLSALRVPPRLLPLIEHGWVEGCGYPSRSELDSAVVVSMLRAEHSEAEIRAVFAGYAIGEKYREVGYRYLKRTIQSAKAWIAAGSGAAPGTIREWAGALEVRRDRRWEIIFNRPMRAVARFSGEDYGFKVVIPTPWGDEDRLLRSEDFVGAGPLKRAIRMAGAWTGGDTDVQRLLPYLEAFGPPHRRAVRVVGWHDDTVVFPNAQLVEGRFVDALDYLYVGELPSARLLDCHEWESLAKEVGRLLPRVHARASVLPVIGWTLATFAAPQVRVLDGWQFPLLQLFGSPGTGKTTMLGLVGSLVGQGSIDTAGITKWALIKVVGSSNSLPVLIDEHRDDDRQMLRRLLHPVLRSAYNAHYESRGLPTLGTVRVRLTAPIAVSGEVPFRDPALVERTIFVRMEVTGKNEAVLHELRGLPLQRFNAGMYQLVRGADVPALWARTAALIPRGTTGDRQWHGWRVVAFGLLLFEPFWQRPVEEIVQEAAGYRTEEGIEVPVAAVVHEAVRVIAELVKARRIREGQEFAIRQDEGGRALFWFVPALVLPLVEEYFVRIPTDLPMSRDVVRSRMREESRMPAPIVLRYSEGFRLQSGRSGRSGVSGIALDLERIEDRLGIPVQFWLQGAVESSSM